MYVFYKSKVLSILLNYFIFYGFNIIFIFLAKKSSADGSTIPTYF